MDVGLTPELIELNRRLQRDRARDQIGAGEVATGEPFGVAVDVPSSEARSGEEERPDLKSLLEEWFDIEDDTPFWEYAGITEEQYREWVVTT